jgi:hypothetical protein
MRRIILTVLTIAAVTVTAIMGLVPANGSSRLRNVVHLHETYNGSMYLTTDGTSPYGLAETGLSPGRDLTLIDTGHTYHDPSGICPASGCEIFDMVLNSGFCLGSDNSYIEVEIRNCTDDLEWWAIKYPPPAVDDVFINVAASNALSSFGDQVMDGTESTGVPIYICTYQHCPKDTFTNWSF